MTFQLLSSPLNNMRMEKIRLAARQTIDIPMPTNKAMELLVSLVAMMMSPRIMPKNKMFSLDVVISKESGWNDEKIKK